MSNPAAIRAAEHRRAALGAMIARLPAGTDLPSTTAIGRPMGVTSATAAAYLRDNPLLRRWGGGFYVGHAEPESPEPFRERLERLRVQCGLSAPELARAVGVSRVALWHWQNGTAVPRRPRLEALARALGTTVDYLRVGVGG